MQVNWFELVLDLLLLGALALPGVWFLWLGVRYRKSGPVCQGCRYRMEMAQGLTCPECGRVAKNEAEFLKGRIRWKWLAAGVVLCLPVVIELGTWARGYRHAAAWWEATERLKAAAADGRLNVRFSGVRPDDHGPVKMWVRRGIYWSMGNGSPTNWDLHHDMPSHQLSYWDKRVPAPMKYACYVVDFACDPKWHMVRHFSRGVVTDCTLKRPTLQDMKDLGEASHVGEVTINLDNSGKEAVMEPGCFEALKRLKWVWKARIHKGLDDQAIGELIDTWEVLEEIVVWKTGPRTAQALGRHKEADMARLGDISGITDEGFKALCQNRRMTHLSLESVMVGDDVFEAIQGMKQLKTLFISNSKMREYCTRSLGTLSNLTTLYVSGETWNSLAELEGLVELRSLSLSLLLCGPIVSRAGTFAKLERLEVDLGERDGAIAPGDLSGLTGVKNLRLGMRGKMAPGGWDELGKLTGVTDLQLLRPGFLADEELRFLKSMKVLRHVEVHEYARNWKCPLTGTWARGLGDCRALTLMMEPVREETMRAIGELKSLQELRIYSKRENALSMGELAKVVTLKKLSLHWVTDQELEVLGANPNLEDVHLSSQGNCSPEGVAKLLAGKNLKTVRVQGTRWTVVEKARFAMLNVGGSLESLNVD